MDWTAMIIRIVRVITETGSGRSIMASLTWQHYKDFAISMKVHSGFKVSVS